MVDQVRGSATSPAQQTARGQRVGAKVDQPVSAAEIARSLKGIDFPANRDDLVQQAKFNNARAQVVEKLSDLVDKEYSSLADVEHEFHEAKMRH